MIKNKKTYAEIDEYSGKTIYPAYYDLCPSCYKVKFITEWDITFLGKVIKHKTKTEDVPLLFKSKDVAEDYCSVHPYLITDVFVNTFNARPVKYHTYRILQNKKIIGYIKWDDRFIKTTNKEGIIFNPMYNVVDMFAEDIIVNSWIHTSSVINGVKYVFPEKYLSQIIKYEYNHKKDIINHWRYELVEQ